MRLWVDASSLHATERCLRQTGEAHDAADQLHLATHLAFADQLLIGSYGGGSYLRGIKPLIFALESIGFEPNCIEIVDTDRANLEQIYIGAGNALASQLHGIADLFDYHETFTSDQLSPIALNIEARFHSALRQNLTRDERAALYEEVKHSENNALLVTLTKSDAFWEATRRLVADGNHWSPVHSARLATQCRIFIHQAHAKHVGAEYAPGRKRGRSLRDVSLSVSMLRILQELPGRVIDGFKRGDTGLPPIAAVLAQRAKGNPFGLMEETLRIRDRAKPLREHLERVITTCAQDDFQPYRHAYQAMEQLTNDLRVHLNVKTASSLIEALDIFNLDGFLITLLGSGKLVGTQKLIPTLLALLRSNRIVVLSEMAAQISMTGIDPAALAALERGVSAKRQAFPRKT